MPEQTYKYSKDSFLKYLREKDPELSKLSTYPDYMIYDMGVDKYSKHKGEIEPFVSQEKIEQTRKEKEENVSPGAWNRFKHSPLGLGVVIPGMATDANSSEWQKASLQQSLQGTAELAAGGKLPYDLKEYDLDALQQIFSGVVGLLYPLDAITMFGGGGLAGAGLKTVAKTTLPKSVMKKQISRLGKRGMKSKVVQMAEKTGLDKTTLGDVVEHMAGSAGQFMLYEGAKGGAAAKVAGEDWKQGVFEGVGHGALVGAALGFTGGVLSNMNKNLLLAKNYKAGTLGGYSLGKKLTPSQKHSLESLTKNNPFMNWSTDKINRGLKWTGKWSQYGAEVGTFTGVGSFERWRAGEEFNWGTLATDLFVNAGFIGVLKSGNYAVKKAAEQARGLSTVYEQKLETAIKEADSVERSKKAVNDDIKTQSEGKTKSQKKKLEEQLKINEEEVSGNKEKEIEIIREHVQDYANLDTRLTALYETINTIINPKIDAKTSLKLLEEKKLVINDIQRGLLESRTLIEDSKLEGYEVSNLKRLEKELLKFEDDINNHMTEKKQIVKEVEYDTQSQFSKDIEELKGAGRKSIKVIKDGKTKTVSLKNIKYEDVESRRALGKTAEAIREKSARETTQTAEETVRLLEGDKPEVVFEKEHGTSDADFKKMKLKDSEGSEKIFTDSRTKENFADIIRAFKGITKTVQKKIIQGVQEFFPNASTKATRKDLNNLLDYASWLQKNKIELGENTGLDFKRYLEQTGKWDNRNAISKSLAKFFGTFHSAGKQPISQGQGFAGKYMKKDAGVLNVKWKEVEPGKATRIKYQDRQKMKTSVNKTFGKKKDININELIGGNQKGSIVKDVLDSMLGVFYNFAKRSGEVLRLRAEDINIKDGTVRFFVSKKRSKETFKDINNKPMKDKDGNIITGEYITYNLKDTNPSLWKNLQATLKGKKGKDYIFTLKGSKNPISGAGVNKILDAVIKKSGVEPTSIRGGEKFTSHHHRHSMMVDAEAIKTKFGKDFTDLVSKVFLSHRAVGEAKRFYQDANTLAEIKEFQNLRKKLKEGDYTEKDIQIATEKLKTIEKDLGVETEIKTPEKPIKKKKGLPLPPEPPKERAIRKLKEAKTIHEEGAKNPELYKEYDTSAKEQSNAAKDKNFVISAVEGTYFYRDKSLKLVNKYIKSHQKALSNKEGSVKWHKDWIKEYESIKSLLKEMKNDHDLTSGERLVKHQKKAHAISGDLGHSKKQQKEHINELFPDKKYNKINELEITDLKHYIDVISKMSGKDAKVKFRAKKKEAELIAEEYGISYDDVTSILKSLGVKDGSFDNITNVNTLKRFISSVESVFDKIPLQSSASKLVISSSKEGSLGQLNFRRKAWYPLVELLYKFGGENGQKLADKFLDFDVANIRYRRWATRTTDKSKAALKKAGFKKSEDYMFMFMDKDLRKLWKNDFTSREKDFLKLLESKSENPINKAASEINKMYDIYWREIVEVAKSISPKSKHHLVEQFFEKKRIRQYFTRRVAPEVLEAIKAEQGTFYEQLLHKNIKRQASALKRTDFKTDKAFDKAKKNLTNYFKGNEELYPYDKAAINKIKGDIEAFFLRPQTSMRLSFLKERVFDLPRKVSIVDAKGKIKEVNSYVESFDGTVGYYGVGTSKFLSTLKYFPEFTDIGKQFGFQGSKINIFEMISKKGTNRGLNQEWAAYMRVAIAEHLGLEGDYKSRINRKTARKLGELSTLSAAMGLSSPTSGLKNLAIGIPRSIGHFGLTNTTLALIRMNTGHEDLVRRKIDWVKEYGSKQLVIEAQKLPWGLDKVITMDKLFQINLMTKTEGINRIVSSYAGNLTFESMLSSYHGQKGSRFKPIGGNKEIERAWKDVWKLSKKEREFLKNTKFEELWKPENKEMMSWITTKVQHFSHVATQGSTSSALLPRWMSNEWTRPLTLFQRMAWSTTADIRQNYLAPIIRTGNFMPIVRAAAAHTMSGMLLYKFYDFMFDQEIPKQLNESQLDRFLPFLWRSEFFGLFGEFMNPYSSSYYDSKKSMFEGLYSGDASMSKGLLEPVIVRNVRLLWENVPYLLNGVTGKEYPKKFWHQAVAEIGKNSIVLGGQLAKLGNRFESTEFMTHKRIKTIARDFMKEKGYSYPDVVMDNIRSPYYKDLKKSFWKGNKDEWARTYWNAYNFLVSEYQKEYHTPASAHKKAVQAIKSSLSYMNPIKFSVDLNGRTISKRKEFLDYIGRDKAKKKLALDLEKEYNYKNRKFWAEVGKSKYRRKYSVFAGQEYKDKYTPKLFGTF